jgi:hypothetical protein
MTLQSFIIRIDENNLEFSNDFTEIIVYFKNKIIKNKVRVRIIILFLTVISFDDIFW